MKWLVTGIYTLVITLALTSALQIANGTTDDAIRVFIAGLVIFFAALEIGEEWHRD